VPTNQCAGALLLSVAMNGYEKGIKKWTAPTNTSIPTNTIMRMSTPTLIHMRAKLTPMPTRILTAMSTAIPTHTNTATKVAWEHMNTIIPAIMGITSMTM
jgi:hypothetical protein